MTLPKTGAALDLRVPPRYGDSNMPRRFAAYFPKGWQGAAGNRPVIVFLHGTIAVAGHPLRLGYYKRIISGFPSAPEIGSAGTTGNDGNGPDFRYLPSGAPVPVVAGYAPVGQDFTTLCETYHFAAIAPQLVSAGDTSTRGYQQCDEDSVKSIIMTLQERGWIGTTIYIAGHSAGGSLAWTIAMRNPSLFAAVCLLHSEIEPDHDNANYAINTLGNQGSLYTWNVAAQTLVDPNTSAGGSGTHNFFTDATCRAMPVFAMSSSHTSDGNQGLTYAGRTRLARTNWGTANSFTKIFARDIPNAGRTNAIDPQTGEANGLGSFGGGTSTLYGPSLGSPPGTANRYYWPSWLHAHDREWAVRFFLAVETNTAYRFDM